jgi:hypothetical protein
VNDWLKAGYTLAYSQQQAHVPMTERNKRLLKVGKFKMGACNQGSIAWSQCQPASEEEGQRKPYQVAVDFIKENYMRNWARQVRICSNIGLGTVNDIC